MRRSLLCLVLIVLLCSSAFAHPGGTDSKGGHTNRSTGEYHYHHGYSAHQHPDGECPYDFDDKTGSSSGSSSKKSGFSSYKPKATPKPTITPKPSPKPTVKPSRKGRSFSFEKVGRWILIGALLAIPISMCIGLVVGLFIAIGNFIRFLRDNKWTIPFIVLFVGAAVVGLYLIFKHPL